MGKNLEANNKLFLFVHIEIIELFKLFIENPHEPSLKKLWRRGLLEKVKREIDGYISDGGSDWRKVLFEKLLQWFVAKELVPPLRDGVFQMGLELFPKFHCWGEWWIDCDVMMITVESSTIGFGFEFAYLFKNVLWVRRNL